MVGKMNLADGNTEIRRAKLIQEILSGELQKDVLLNASFAFDKERQAAYFSRTRENMRSEMAYATMHHADQIDDLAVLEVLKNDSL